MEARSESAARQRVLVTGGDGMVGRALVAELRAQGYATVIALTRADADLTEAAAAERAIARAQPNVVYHLAARVHGLGGNLRSQGESYLANIRINTNVIEAARRAGVAKIVAMGSTAVYSDEAPRPLREEHIWTGKPHGSEAGYAHAKRAMLAQLEAYESQYGLAWAFCAATNLFGPHDRFDEQTGHVIPSLLSKFERGARTGSMVTVWGSGVAERDFLYVADAARALRLVGESHHGPINLASGTPISIAETVRLLVRVSGYHGNVWWDRSMPDGQVSRRYDVSRLAELGFTPRYAFEDALRLTLEWLRDNPEQARR